MARLEMVKNFFEVVDFNPKSLTKFTEINFIDYFRFIYQNNQTKLTILENFNGILTLDGNDLVDNSIQNIEIKSDNCQLILINGIKTRIEVDYEQINALSKIRVEGDYTIDILIAFNSKEQNVKMQECYLPDLKFTPYNLTLLNLNMNVSSLVLFCFHELFILNRIEIVFEKVSEIHVNSLNYHIVSLIETSCDTKFKVIFNKYSNQGSCLVRIENPKLEKVEFRNSIL